jgi:hypothetical protein
MARFHLHTAEADATHSRRVFVELLEHDLLDDHILVTPGCGTGQELDDWIDRLITQLNAVRHKGWEHLTQGPES